MTPKLVTMSPRVILASAAYIDRFGAPTTPSDLTRHRIVGGPASSVPLAWTFERDGETKAVDLQLHFSTNDNEGAIAAAVAGIGITSTSGWACRPELTDGSLIRLLPDWKTVDIPVYACFPLGSATPAAGRAIVEYLCSDFRREEEAALP